MDRTTCSLCGGYHTEGRCRKVDDGPAAGRNGEYAGTAVVVVIPPGWTFLSRLAEERLPAVACGQLWYSPERDLFRVCSVRGQIVVLSAVGQRYSNIRVRLSTLRARWTYWPGVVRHG
jgi:hypothetical protein